jgi:hypothetical protein
MKRIVWLSFFVILFASCTKSVNSDRYLIFRFKFDPNQERLDSNGVLTPFASSGNTALTPIINSAASHYLELCQGDSIPFGLGEVLFHGPEKDSATVDFSQCTISKEGDIFFSIPLSMVTPGVYKWLRMSVVYENMSIPIRLENFVKNNVSFTGVFDGTLVGFLGRNNYIESYTIKTATLNPSPKKQRQGLWSIETSLGSGGYQFAPETYTDKTLDEDNTFVNPSASKIKLPRGSCITTGLFYKTRYNKQGEKPTFDLLPLTITGAETESIIIDCSLSTNKSFEYRDNNNNKYFDPFTGEPVVDMGFRGLNAIVK